ncbi:hypothetical protein GWK47_033293 [Chionoecetes opilio]|uniref:Uncharacterized protein n=1 Tax=Chionoecetes opilio TaxID=41210 RepID=A0A8J4YS75_CHIOP|nr:hypothetical protein GWK47_033293 [Chionoecetes opilio]
MRYSGLMPSARPAASLSTKHSKRLRKQIVFKTKISECGWVGWERDGGLGRTHENGEVYCVWSRVEPATYIRIGDTIHSGPSLVAPALPKDENINPSSKCVFPSNLQESTRISLDSDHLAQIPSPHPALRSSSETLCHSSPAPCTPCIQNCLGTKGSLPAAHVPDIIVPKTNVSKASNIKTVRSSVVKDLAMSKVAHLRQLV